MVNVTEPDAGERLVASCEERFGRLDAVVNNAGTTWVDPLEELTDEDWRQQWEVHVMGSMRVMRAAAPRMAEQGYGRIVNVCSAAGRAPSQTNVAYSVANAAQLSLSRAFADAYAPWGVLVNAVAPGPVASPLWMGEGGLADQMAERQGVSREHVIAASCARVPLGRYGTEEEIAAVILFLCSELASYVSGAAWSVDGGFVSAIV